MQQTFIYHKIILDLCGGTGAWSKPYREAGYDVRLVTLPDDDVRTYVPPDQVYGILAAPPCTDLAGSGARWWKEKGHKALLEGLSIVDACLRIVLITSPVWWCLENPVGKLRKWLGPPVITFQPSDFGDPYTKRTCLWGEFTPPEKSPVFPLLGSAMAQYPPSEDRARLRSITPPGFAKAFFEANP